MDAGPGQERLGRIMAEAVFGMLPYYSGETCDEVWRAAACALIGDYKGMRADSRLGPTRESLHCVFEVSDPRQRWVLSRRPAMNPAFAIAEVLWILAGSDDSKFINYWNPRLPLYAGRAKRYHGAYGRRLRRHFGMDQIDRACNALAGAPDTRQVVLQIWDAKKDFPLDNGSPRASDIPCSLFAMLKVRDGRLHWTQVLRSNDVFLGTPYNFVQFTFLQELVAGCVGVELGPYIQISDSLHLYATDAESLRVDPAPTVVRNDDRLGLPRPELDRVLTVVHEQVKLMTHKGLSRVQLKRVLQNCDLPGAWRNLLCVLAADAARKRGWTPEAAAAISECTNPVLALSWRQWHERASGIT